MERKSNAQVAILAISFIAILVIASGLYWFNIVKPVLEDDMQSLASSMASARANEFATFLGQGGHDEEDIIYQLDAMLAYTFEHTQKQFFLSVDLELSEDFQLENNVNHKIARGRKSCENCFVKDYPLYSSDSFRLLGVLTITVSNIQANTYIKTVQHLFIIGAAVVLVSLIFLLIFIWNSAAAMDQLNANLEYEVAQRTRKLSNEIDEHAQTQARLNTARDEIQRLERSRIAKTLHDGVGQVLQALKLGLQRLSLQIEGDNKQLVNELVEETGEAISIIRDFCSELRPLHLERMSLSQALYSHVERLDRRLPTMQLTMQSTTQLTTQEQGDDEFELSEMAKEQLFLIAVELLNNALKHSQATNTEVILSYRKDFLVLTVTDNGIGACLAQSDGLGLSVIKERCERIGASIVFSAPVEQGLEARCELPVNINKL
jgi:signal transduction histidine kinase